MLHCSMKEHYNKVGSYIRTLKDASPHNVLVLVNNYPIQRGPKPVFQRIFICFDGIRRGWIEGCMKVSIKDACFLKTFLGGKLLAVVERDANDQMYPVACAMVEGENNLVDPRAAKVFETW